MKHIIHHTKGYWQPAGRGYTTDVLDAGLFADGSPEVLRVDCATSNSTAVDARKCIREAIATAIERDDTDGRVLALAERLLVIRSVSETAEVQAALDESDDDPIRPMLAAASGGAP